MGKRLTCLFNVRDMHRQDGWESTERGMRGSSGIYFIYGGWEVENLNKLRDLVDTAIAEAMEEWGPYHSYHEGSNVIREEFEELWDEVKAEQNPEQLRKEALHTAATAIRFIYDLL